MKRGAAGDTFGPSMVTLDDVRAARERIRDRIYLSPCARSETLSRATGCQAFLKLENLQMTGAYKERGALSRLSDVGGRAAWGCPATPTRRTTESAGGRAAPTVRGWAAAAVAAAQGDGSHSPASCHKRNVSDDPHG